MQKCQQTNACLLWVMGYRIVYSGKWLGACCLRLRVDSYEDGDNTLF